MHGFCVTCWLAATCHLAPPTPGVQRCLLSEAPSRSGLAHAAASCMFVMMVCRTTRACGMRICFKQPREADSVTQTRTHLWHFSEIVSVGFGCHTALSQLLAECDN
jgi:hypothetical protein